MPVYADNDKLFGGLPSFIAESLPDHWGNKVLNEWANKILEENPHIKLYSDKYIRHIAKLLNENMNKIQVLTIALSPDCVDGEDIKSKWNNSFQILKIMSEEIDDLKDFPFPNK